MEEKEKFGEWMKARDQAIEKRNMELYQRDKIIDNLKKKLLESEKVSFFIPNENNNMMEIGH